MQIYLKFEQSSRDPARVQLLYERAITEFPVSSDLWLGYTHYLDKTLKVLPHIFSFRFYMFQPFVILAINHLFSLQVGNIVRDVYSRATKNCPWVGELWVGFLLALERCHVHEKEMSNVSLSCYPSSVE